MRPTPRLLLSHPAHFLSLGFGAGLSPWAPGTAGTLLAWALYPLLRVPLSEFVFFAMLISFFLAGVIATERTVDYAAPQAFSRNGDQLIVETRARRTKPLRNGFQQAPLRQQAGSQITVK